MRGVFLLSFLIGIGILTYLWSTSAQTASTANKKAQKEVAPITGRGPDGGTITDSAEFAPDRAGLAVTTVKPGSYFDQFFALQAGDVIVRAGDVDLKGIDEETAKAFLYEAAQRKRSLDVLRAGQKVTLDVK